MALHPSIRIEGGLLGPDLVDQLLAGELTGQRAADFGLDGRRNLTDEIAAAFADARALWGVFQHRIERVPEGDPATSVTRDAWAIPFLGLLGYDLRYNQKAYDVDGMTFAISHRAGEAEASPPVHIVGLRQELGRVPASGRPRLAPHSLVQEYLNRTENVWGVVTNGKTLRLLRDCTFIRRQAYVEFDLPGILEEQRFQDFAALYRLLHRTRLPRGTEDSNACLLEKFYSHSIEQGGRVREHLRDGVEQCITLLANGFLHCTRNEDLIARTAQAYSGNDRIAADELYRQLLTIVYRFLFLLVSEDRGVVGASSLYREHYSVTRLRRLVTERAASTEHDDLWQSLRVLWLVLIKEQAQPSLGNQTMAATLGLPVLNGELFEPTLLDGCSISNADLLLALWHLTWYHPDRSSAPRRINYAALDVEELGSVYESLLEFDPHLDSTERTPRFALLLDNRERRSTGSHYTPPELVAPLVQHALEPVLADRLAAAAVIENRKSKVENQTHAILSIKVCDLACGSGHFLLAAARRLGKELARVRTAEDEPSPEHVREAIRDVVSHCIYGVDKNSLAVDLCRVALWLESHTADKPLTFLNHRIRCGDSLVGVFDLAVLEAGIPDNAYKPAAGDDRTIARRIKAENKDERDSRARVLSVEPADQVYLLSAASHELEATGDDSVEQVRRKANIFASLEQEGSNLARLQLACHLWTAAFFAELTPASAESQRIPTTDSIRTALAQPGTLDARLRGFAQQAAHERRFFHWPLMFPEVFEAGGFDVILGNPPFLGGLRISTQFGDKYRQWLEGHFAPFSDRPDFCAAFLRQGFRSIRETGALGLIATNTIGQGATRESGLAAILADRGSISFAQRYVKWPGLASVEVNLVVLRRIHPTPVTLDQLSVQSISSRLDSEAEQEAATLSQNVRKAFIGNYVHGIGFVLDLAESRALCDRDVSNFDCLFPYLNGADLNGEPDHRPTRDVIYFRDWSLERASEFADLMRIVEQRVRPERAKCKSRRPRELWWQFEHLARGLEEAARELKRVLVRSEVSENHMIAFVPRGWVYSHMTIVFAFDDDYHFALLQSNVHEAWVRRNASTMRTDIRYTPTDCFETFAFPQQPSETARTEAERLGAAYHEHRRHTMLARQLGLTKTYNLFHKPDCADADITRLRELHAALDRAILACYGWSDIDPDHGFHQNERGQTRCTISPTARREILRRLLTLNLEIATREAEVKSSAPLGRRRRR